MLAYRFVACSCADVSCVHLIPHFTLKQQHGHCPWLTLPRHKGKHIVNSGNTVTKTVQSSGSCTAIVADGVTIRHDSSTKKRWSFTIKKGTKQSIGVVTSAFNAARDEYVNKTTNGWGIYQYNGNKGHDSLTH